MTDTPLILFRGDVYSSADPFATALSFAGPTVAWVGEDEAAIATVGTKVDLDGDLVTPGFVHAGLLLTGEGDPDPASLPSAGITSAHVLGPEAAVRVFREEAPDALAITAHPFGAPDGPTAIMAADLPSHLTADRPLFIVVADATDLTAVLDALDDAEVRARAQRALWRLLVTCPVPSEAVPRLAGLGIGLTLDPGAHDQPLAPLLSAGAQVSFALDTSAPWTTLRSAVYGSSTGISARAAFNAATRFGFRAVGQFEGGVLAPGAEATAVRWEVGELVVQVADERLAAWSTDPRSGTPGLPDLSGESPLPVVRDVWVRGQRHAAWSGKTQSA
ncbi:amidohydrolase family protein [Brevibacterium yomogidense]|uniref:metal-dependent hydrolase n=1 Tax=Brevibacterium yomogidense TaxID=946573 RepID=UPI0018E02DAD|nr:metal-dependent hydrolase [Brevibacterium yomogidense]